MLWNLHLKISTAFHLFSIAKIVKAEHNFLFFLFFIESIKLQHLQAIEQWLQWEKIKYEK